MPSSVVLLAALLLLLTAAAAAAGPAAGPAAAAAVTGGSRSPYVASPRSSTAHRQSAPLGNVSRQSAPDGTVTGLDRSDAAQANTHSGARTAAPAAGLTGADASQEPPGYNAGFQEASEELQGHTTSSSQRSLHPLSDLDIVPGYRAVAEDWLKSPLDLTEDWLDTPLDELIDPRFLIVSGNSSNNITSSVLAAARTAVLIAGKIVLTVLLICLSVALFFALGFIGNTSEVYNRYGHFDPYSPWAPYTANGAIDQPGYKGRSLDHRTGGGELKAVLRAIEETFTSSAPCLPPRKCRYAAAVSYLAHKPEWRKERTSRTKRSEEGAQDAPVRTQITSAAASRWPPGGDLPSQQFVSSSPRQSAENGPVLGAVQSVVSVLVPVALLLPWLVLIFLPGLLPLGDGQPVPPDDFPFDSDDDDNDRPYRRSLPRRRVRRRRRELDATLARH